MGRIDAAVASFRNAIRLDPASAGFAGNLAYSVHFHPDYGPKEILQVNRDLPPT